MIFDESLKSKSIIKSHNMNEQYDTSLQNVIQKRSEQIVLDNLTNIYTVY
jgi:hypothetical protein